MSLWRIILAAVAVHLAAAREPIYRHPVIRPAPTAASTR